MLKHKFLTFEVYEFLIHSFRENANIWLNGVALTSVRKLGKVSSLTVSPGVENALTLQYRGSALSWTLKTMPGKPFILVFFSFTEPKGNKILSLVRYNTD